MALFVPTRGSADNVNVAQAAQQFYAGIPPEVVISVPVPKGTTRGSLDTVGAAPGIESLSPAQLQQAIAARQAGKNVVIKTPEIMLGAPDANRLIDYMIANGTPATPAGAVSALIPSGAATISGNSLTGTISKLGSELGTPALAALAAGYGLNALSGLGGAGSAAAGAAGGTSAGGAFGAIVPEGGTLLADGTILDAAGTVVYTPSISGGAGLLGSIPSAIGGAGGTAAGSALGAIVPEGGTLLADGTILDAAGTVVYTPSISGGAGLLGSVPSAISSAGSAIGAGGGLFGTGITGTQALSTGLGMLGSALQGRAATDAAQQSANAQIEAARIAAEASKFRPVGVTTRFGQSQFGYDPQGNLVSAGYQLSPELKAQQDALMAMSGQALTQYQGAPAATAPMAQGAQTLFGLGQGYLATTPQEQAAKFMAEQQALLAPSREREMAALQNRLQAQGRLGLATGGTSTGLMASNPELEAFYNAQRMQDLQLAAQATQGGQQYATFGAGLLGTGGELQKSMYGTQQAAFAPYQTALGGATTLESLGQQPMDIGTSIGAKTSTAAARAGELVGQGMLGAAQTMQPANAYSPWGALLTGAGQAIGQYGQPQQQQYRFDPFSGRAL